MQRTPWRKLSEEEEEARAANARHEAETAQYRRTTAAIEEEHKRRETKLEIEHTIREATGDAQIESASLYWLVQRVRVERMNDVANTDPTYIKLQNACRHNLKKGEPGYEYWVESCNQLALYEKGIRGAVKIELDELIAEVRESLRSEKLGVFSAKNEDVTDSCMMCGVGVSDQ